MAFLGKIHDHATASLMTTGAPSNLRRLFLPHAVFIFVCFAVIGTILFWIWTRTLEQHLIREAREIRAESTRLLVNRTISPEDLMSLRKEGVDSEAFREKMTPILTMPQVFRVNVFGPDLSLIWSDAMSSPSRPETEEANSALFEALGGEIQTRIIRPLGEVFRAAMEIYVPVYLEALREPSGIIQIDVNLDPLFATINKTKWLIGATVAVGLGVVLAALFAASNNVIAVIREQNQALARQEETQKLLKEVSQDITALDLDSLLKKLTAEARNALRADISDVWLIEEGRRRILGVSGIAPEALQGGNRMPRKRAGSWTIENRRPLVSRDVTQEPDFPVGDTTRTIGVRGYLSVPLYARGGNAIGIMRALSFKPRTFTQGEIDFLQQLANGAAIAIENARLFEELGKKTRELEEAYQAKSDFFNMAAHELRTPLNAITGYANLIEDGYYGAVKDPVKTAIGTIGQTAKGLLGLINEILDLARLEARRVPLQIEEFAAAEVVAELRDSFTPLVKKRGLTLKFDLPDEELRFKSDKSKINVILRNLLSNAVNYTDKGGIELRVRRETSSSPATEEQAVFSVRDTGVGIKKSDLSHIFDPFYTGENVDRREHPRTGLGLSIVTRLVELVRGKIDVESEEGKGSTFNVRLPLVLAAEAQAEA